MLLKPKIVRNTNSEEFENKLLIEKWMKRNSSSKVTIGTDVSNKKNEKCDKSSNKKISSPSEVELRVSKTDPKKFNSNIVKQLTTSNKITSQSKTLKRSKPLLSDSSDVDIKTKIADQSLPIRNVKERPVIKRVCTRAAEKLSVSNYTIDKLPISNCTIEKLPVSNCTIEKLPISNYKTKTIFPKASKNVLCSIERVKTPSAKISVKQKNTPPDPVVQCNLVKTISLTTPDLNPKNIEINTSNKESLKNDSIANNKAALQKLLSKEVDSDVFTSLLDNYRYLITPKSWSVTEFIDESKERYIVFFNLYVVKENDVLISVMKKSLIIDKNAIMSYSVHGLPVKIQGTILPKALDNTKKLLSILHIFDKMQVCEGIGNDLTVNQSDLIFKDNCRYWRHKDCTIVLIKATQCPICIRHRILILKRKETLGKNELTNLFNLVPAKVKKED